MWFIYLFFTVFFCYCSGSLTKFNDSSTLENVIARTNGFLLSMPKVLVLNRNETVCLTLHDTKLPARITIDIKWREKHSPTTRSLLADHTCFDVYVQNLPITEPSFVTVKVQIEMNGTVQYAHNADPVVVYPRKIIRTHIVTDRSTHMPGDKVRFRILVLDEHLLPQNLKIPDIRIKNPLDVTVAVWENISPENGLVILEYQMVAEAITGKWKIELLGEEQTFEVLKYILPRYKISLLHPTSIYYEENHLNISVCGLYPYGRHVEGLAFIRITSSHSKISLYYMKKMENGCAEFTISSEQLDLSARERIPNNDPRMYLYITSTITEAGTNRIDITNGRIYIFFKPYSVKFISNPIFQPGLPYRGKLKLFNVKTNISNELIEICYNLALKRSWNYLNVEHCSNFSVGEDSSINFYVLPLRSSIIHIILKAKSVDHADIEDKLLVARLYSVSNSYISLQYQAAQKANSECRAPQQFKVVFTSDRFREHDNVTFYYMIKSFSSIYKQRKLIHQVRKTTIDYLTELENIVGRQHKYTKLGVPLDSFIVKFRLDRKVISKYQFLIYYVTDYGEIVAVNRNVEVEPCLMKVTAKWNQNEAVPGATATLSIETGANSICSLTAIDKAITFLPNQKPTNDVTNLLKSFHSQDKEPLVSGRKSCVTPTRRSAAGTLILPENESQDNQLADLERKKRHIFSFSEDFDAYDTFSRFGITVITNLNIITKTCYTGPMVKEQTQVQFLTEYEDHNEEQVVSIRSHFPETWLWELIPVSKSVQLNRHLPHTLTNWVTNVLCVSEEEGMGISDQIEITSFQLFFVEVLNPHSIKRGEAFYLTVHISNYLMQTFPVRIVILLSKGLELVNPNHKLMVSKCFPKNSTSTHVVQLRANKIGSVTVTVLAEVDNKFPEECGPETMISKRDIVLKKIHVDSEGYPMKITHSVLLCTSGLQHSNNVSWDFQTPKNLVPETDHTYISLNGDLLGNTIENLENLLEVPSGCGEQIMASIAPNLYVLRYLNATGDLKHSMKQRIVKYLKIGYQRILNYGHKDGSFSAFGYHDPTGSMFLTAFVVRILQRAKRYIYVDQIVINKAVDWIFEHQLENGCFDAMLHVFQDMGGTSKENSTASLTSYVIISLLESNIEIPELVQTNAKYCIRGQQNPDKYTLAISCYALFKMKWVSEANKILTKLLAVAEQQNNMLWWKNKDNESSATDIEITSYVLLSLLDNNNTHNLAKAHSIVRWLSSKFESKGAFKTSQDTVVALDALTKYSQMVKFNNTNLTIYIDSYDYSESVKIESSNRMKSRRLSLEKFVGKLNILAKGEGCVLAQVTHIYHLLSIPKTESFQLAVDVSPVSNIDKCSIVSLSPCLAYTGPDDISNMAVMEVSLPTGYEADRASLYKLVETEKTTGVKMFEELGQKVNLYLTKLGKQLICFEFNLNKYSNIQNMKNSSIKLFDYYRPEYEILEFYKLNETCTLEDLASLIPTPVGAEDSKRLLPNGLDNLTETDQLTML